MTREKRTKILHTRLSEAEARVIELYAEQRDMSVSTLIRLRLFPSRDVERKKGIPFKPEEQLPVG